MSPSTLPDYDTKIKAFYEEHIHTDEEIRYVREGSGKKGERSLSTSSSILPSNHPSIHPSFSRSFLSLLSLLHPSF